MSRRKPPDTASFVSESRSAQGFPERVENPAALATVAALLRSASASRSETRKAHRPPASVRTGESRCP